MEENATESLSVYAAYGGNNPSVSLFG